MNMLKVVNTPNQSLANIHRFEGELERSPELQSRLAYARAWYAHQDGDRWFFAPSKFVGYENINAESYLKAAEESDGRRTEAQLQGWFQVVDPTTALHEELSSALFGFLAKYGKTPSTKARINVLKSRRSSGFEAPNLNDARYDAVVKLMIEYAKTLPTAQLQCLRDGIDEIWT
jgi:hypothetical protein